MSLADLIDTPTLTGGQPTGIGDWYLVVEAALPEHPESRWDLVTWDNFVWTEEEWVGLTSDLRGVTWTRGADLVGGESAVGTATLTLSNLTLAYSPWKASLPVGDDGGLTSPYAPGLLVRIGCYDTTSLPNFLPQFTGVVNTWRETFVAGGADRYVTVELDETVAVLATIKDLATSTRAAEMPDDRLLWLLELGDWPYGYDIQNLGSTVSTMTVGPTDASAERLGEAYLTAFSGGGIFRSAKSGKAYFRRTVGEYADLAIGSTGGSAWWSGSWGLSTSEGLLDGVTHIPYVAEQLDLVHDPSVVVNPITLATSDGSTYTYTADATRYPTSALSRTNTITSSTTLLDMIAADILGKHSVLAYRLEALQLHAAHGLNVGRFMMVADIGDRVPVYFEQDDLVLVLDQQLVSMTHTIEVLNGASVLWSADLQFDTLAITVGDEVPTGTTGVLFTETWTGTNGTAWGANWTGATGGTVDIQSNRGRILPSSASYAEAHTRRAVDPAADFDLTTDILINATSEHYPYIRYREDGASGGDYFRLTLNPAYNTTHFTRYDDHDKTDLASYSFSFNPAFLYHLRLRVVGNSHQFKIWTDGASEPASWQVSVLDATYATQTRFSLGNQAGFTSASGTDWDNLTFYDV